MSPTEMGSELNRLRWRCQRGMLELDHILRGFLESGYGTAPAEVQAAFRAALAMEDADLFDLIVGRRPAASAEMAALLDLLRRPV